GAGVLPHDHPLVDRISRGHEEGGALLQLTQRIRDRLTVDHADEHSAETRVHRPHIRTVLEEAVVQLSLTPRIREELGPVTEEAPRGHPVNQPHESATGVLHLQHLAAALAQLLDDRTGQALRYVDHHLLVRLLALTVLGRTPDHPRSRHGDLVTLQTHSVHLTPHDHFYTPGAALRVRT